MTNALNFKKIFRDLDFNIAHNIDIISFNEYTLTQIAPQNSAQFIDFYLFNYKKVHSSLGDYSATNAMINDVYADNALYKESSVYLILKRNGNLLATLKGTKRQALPLRTEREFGFNILQYLNRTSFDGLSVWHHSKTSIDKDQLSNEKHDTKILLRIIYEALYIKIYYDGCDILLGEVNDLNYRSMDANGIKMEIVTKPLKTIGMPAYGIAISRENISRFINNPGLEATGKNFNLK